MSWEYFDATLWCIVDTIGAWSGSKRTQTYFQCCLSSQGRELQFINDLKNNHIVLVDFVVHCGVEKDEHLVCVEDELGYVC